MHRNGLKIMLELLKLVTPLAHVMLACITMGMIGYFCAIAITVLAANLLLIVLQISPWAFSFKTCAMVMVACAALRAVLRYGEQTCGHYIAFKLLAILRDQVFSVLRQLAPAKLEGRGRGDLISLVTGDIELLEVFYAHTIAPVCIAVVVSAAMTVMIGSFSVPLGIWALVSYSIIGIAIPLLSAGLGREYGVKARERLGCLNNFFLESLRGVRETLQYGQADQRAHQIHQKTVELNQVQGKVKHHEGVTSSWSGAAVMLLTLLMLSGGLLLQLSFQKLLLTTVMLSASFGPVLALANLSATMDQTLAAGERVLVLLEEQPETEEILDGTTPVYSGAAVKNLSFSYGKEDILHDLTASFPQGEIVAVTGKSGSGKSTLLKLLMRFWKVSEGSVLISGQDVGQIQTAHLRNLESYMIQDMAKSCCNTCPHI